MFKFFRQIRQKLIIEHNLRKYLLYALGEVLLVVIGILIALQVNNWNEARKSNIEERKYLISLSSDLKEDKSELLELVENRKLKSNSSTILLEMNRNNEYRSITEISDLMNAVFIWEEFTPKDNTFTELISSGKLHIISSENIKDGLLNLFSLYDDIEVHRNHMRREYDYYLYDSWAEFTTPNVNLKLDITSLYDLLESDEDFIRDNEELLLNEFKDLLSDKTFQSGLFLARINNLGINESYQSAIIEIEKLLMHIDQLVESN